MKRLLPLLGLFLGIFTGCGKPPPTFETKYDPVKNTTDVVWKNVQKVFMHKPGNFTLLVKDVILDKPQLLTITVDDDIPCSILLDAGMHGMWAEKFYNGHCYNFVIHIHDASEIEGAGWVNESRYED